jgi:hypothetical protein
MFSHRKENRDMWETAGETLKVWEEENQRLMGGRGK